MGWPAVVAGAALGYAILSDSSPMDHDETVEATYDELTDHVPADASVYADHIDAPQSPHGEMDGLSRVPDIVVQSGDAHSLVVEVETADSLANDASEARSQLRDFATRGYRRLLVVPPSEEDTDAVETFLKDADFDGEIYLAVPSTASEFL
jgi:hypothetical protein